MGRLLFHAIALAGSAAAGAALAVEHVVSPFAAPLCSALLYLLLRWSGRRLSDLASRRALLSRCGLQGPDRSRFAASLDLLDRGHPDVARATLAGLGAPEAGGARVYQVWARACLRLVCHRSFGEGAVESWAGVTAGHRRVLPRLERALLAPALPSDEPALAAEAAAADERSLAAILGTRSLLLATLVDAVGNPFHPFFARAEQDLERMLGRRFLWLPRRRLRSFALGVQPRRPLPPREEAAVLFLAWGREEAAAAVLAGADAAGTLGRRGRALRSAALVLLFLRRGGEVAVSPELFARRTREILFLHTRDFAMTHGSPHLDAVPDGARRLLDLLREKRSLVGVLAAEWMRRPALGRALGPLARRLAEGTARRRPPRRPRAFLRWWREEGRRADEACESNLRGLALLDEGKPSEAAVAFQSALAGDPGLVVAAFNLAVARTEAGVTAGDPADRLRAVADREPREGRARLLLGEFLERAERLPEAEEAYRAVLAREPMDPDANLALGRLLLEDGRSDEAEEALRRALAARADDPDALVSLASVHLDAGRPADAVPLLKAAVESGEGEPRDDARWLLHAAYRDAEDHPRALEALEAVPDRFLRHREEYLEEAALYLEERRQFDRSARLFERLRELRARRGDL
jgi:predicted Zn-dependent protease